MQETCVNTAWTLVISAVLSLSMAGCGATTTTEPPAVDSQRSGSSLETFGPKYNDSKPILSADGTHIVFISGRDSTDQAVALKIYKADWPQGGDPTSPTRVTSGDDLGFEQEAALSQDGQWVALVAAKDGQTDLYLQDYAGTKSPVRVTNDAAVESHPTFSPDAKLIAWVSRAADTGLSSVQLVALGDGSAAALAQQFTVTTADEDVRQVFWVPTGNSSYELATGAGAGALTYSLRTFSAADQATQATRTDWLKDLLVQTTIAPVAASANVVLVRKDLSSERVLSTKVGDAVDAPSSMLVQTEPVFAVPGTSTVTRFSDPPGYETLGAAMASDGKTAFLVTQQVYKCVGDASDSYGAALVLAPSDVSAPTRLSPRLAADGTSFELVQGYCDRKRADGTVGRIDDKIADLALNAQATQTKYRLAYVTRFTTKFDENCALKSADPEIMVVDVDGDKKVIKPLSLNRAPVTDAGRGGQAACHL